MKRVLLFIMLLSAGNVVLAQHDVFMQMLENKKICNKEDMLTYFLQTNSFQRRANSYYHHYYANKELFTTTIVNDNECYITYQTDNVRDYNEIKKDITSMCPKELAADKSPSYICNRGRVKDVQIIFKGYSETAKVYEILVYQNPVQHEPPYNQSDRVRSGR